MSTTTTASPEHVETQAGISHEAGSARLAALSAVQRRFDALAMVALKADPEPVLQAIVALTKECGDMTNAVLAHAGSSGEPSQPDDANPIVDLPQPQPAKATVSVYLVPKRKLEPAYEARSYESALDYAKRWNDSEHEDATGMIAIVPGERPELSEHDAKQTAYALALTMATRGMVRVKYHDDATLDDEPDSTGHVFECHISLDGTSNFTIDPLQCLSFWLSDNDGAMGEQLIKQLRGYVNQLELYEHDSTDELRQVDEQFDRQLVKKDN